MLQRLSNSVVRIAITSLLSITGLLSTSLPSFAAVIEISAGKQQQPPSHSAWGLLRVRTIGYQLAKANASNCAEPTMQTGLIFHDIGGFSAQHRPSAMRDHGLTYGFGILGLVEGSPGTRAGLRRRDEIVGINGTDLSNFASGQITKKASYDRIEAFEDFLQAELQKGSVTLRLRRGTQYVSTVLEPEPGCGGRFTELATGRLNAWSNGKYVTVSSAMLEFAADDGELAFVMAHEMAHNMLHHNQDISRPAALLSSRQRKAKGGKARELEADALALKIISAAGYEPQSAQRLLDRVRARTFPSLALSHPHVKRRIASVQVELGKMAVQRDRGGMHISEFGSAASATRDPFGRPTAPFHIVSADLVVVRPIRALSSPRSNVPIESISVRARMSSEPRIMRDLRKFAWEPNESRRFAYQGWASLDM